MRFLADESVDMAVVRALRLAGYHVRAIVEALPGASDEEVAALALADDRILLTEDRDFGRLIYAEMQGTRGVIYMRYPARARSALARDVAELVGQEAERLTGCFTVMQPGQTRISRLPEP